MVSRTGADAQGRPNKYTDVGVVGRKTGLMIKDTGRRDSAGLEDMDAFFSPTAERSPRRTGLAPAAPILSYKTRLHNSDEPVSMSGTSSSIRDPKEVLALRKSLVAPHRSPQKTHLKSPAVRVQTPKVNKLDSPSRVKRLLSFTDLEVESFEEDVPLGGPEKEVPESPSEMARSKRGKGLAAGKKAVRPVFSMVEEEDPMEEGDDDTIAESIEGVAMEEDYYGDGGGGFGDDGDGVDELAIEEDVQEEEEEEREEEGEGWEGVQVDDQVEEEEDEDDVEEISPPQPAKRGKRPPNVWSKPAKPPKPATARSKAKSSSTQSAPKRARTTTTSPKIKQRLEKPRPRSPSVDDDGAVRRSTRTRIPPLAHWRGEHIRYELGPRRESGPALPHIKEIVRIDTPPQPTRPPLPNARKRKTPAPDSDVESDTGEVYATIKAFGDDSEIPGYRVAVSGRGIDTAPIQGKQVRMAKVFQDEKYVASGVLDIVVGGQKNVKPTKHSFMSFAVMWGKVEVKLHRTVFHVGRGDFFVVPRGNHYSIKNIGTKDCRLFFSQAVGPELEAPPDETNQVEE